MAELELYLLRHADAGDPDAWTGDDADRPLSGKGRRQADRLGSFLAARGFAPDAIVSSPKTRALQTAERVAQALAVSVTTDDRLGGPLDLALLSNVLGSAGGRRVVVVGHDPDFSDLCAEIVSAAELPLKKGALARIETSLPLTAGGGRLRWLLPPDLVAKGQ
jgi:phosphohistidine phosphatase